MINALGDYYMSCPITMITRKRGQSNETSPEKVRMKGRRFGVFQETDDGEKLNVGIMKEFTGGDKVLVRDLFKGSNEMIEYKPQMKYFLTCNQLPAVPSNDDGTWRRLRVIEFGSKFTDNPTKANEFKIDKNLKQEIKKWGPSFMSYLINIYQTAYKGKFLVEPSEVMASTNQYKMENDFYTEYLMDRVIQTDNVKDTISKETLWEAFRSWFKTNYEGKPPPKKIEFLKMASKLFTESKKGARYEKVIFSPTDDNDEDSGPKNDLDS
jgi:P4 family phage/plasmid primase-like protien